MHILMVTSEWPSPDHPEWVPFIVQQVEYLRRAGIEVDVFPFRGGGSPVNYASSWRKLRAKYRLSQYDVIHAQWGQSGLVALPSQRPLVVTFHGSDLHGTVGSGGSYSRTGNLLRSVSQFVARRASEVIVVAERLIQYLPADIPAHVIPGGIDFELFHPMHKSAARKRLEFQGGKFYVLFPNNPQNPIKRYQLAQKSIDLLKISYDIELFVLTSVPHAEVPLYMNACDALLITSHHEGSPTVVKEALACDLPVVSVDVGDVRKYIAGLSGCVLCQDNKPETIANGIQRVLKMPARPKLSHAVTHLDEALVVERIIQVYQKAISGEKYT